MLSAQDAPSSTPKRASRQSLLPALDFFAGSGLASAGLSTYFDIKWANDNCETKAAMFKANHASVNLVIDSIVNIRGKSLPHACLSWASFPCQDLSLAGQMAGLANSRSGLVWEWLRVMDEMRTRPPVVVAENVVGLVSSDSGRHYHSLHNALVDRGYKVGAILLDAIHWLPQSRPRIFVIGVETRLATDLFSTDRPTWCHNRAIQRAAERVDNFLWWSLPFPEVSRPRLDDLLEPEAPMQDQKTVRHNLSLIPASHRLRLKTAVACGQSVFPAYKRTRNGEQVMELRFDGVAGCLRTPEGGSSRQILVLYKNGRLSTRLISVKEAARLMGVSKNYKMAGTYNEGYKAMGDAVAVPAVRHLSKYLLHPVAAQSL